MLDLASDATLSLAFSLACKRPPVFRARIAAILCDKRGRIVSVGFNQTKTKPLAKRYNPLSGYLHAEMDAILRARREGFTAWTRASLYVARAKQEAKGGIYHIGNAMPCPGCARLIKDVGITSVIHT